MGQPGRLRHEPLPVARRRRSAAALLWSCVATLLALPGSATALVLTTNGPIHQAGWGRPVVLVARAPAGEPVAWSWRQVGGPDVILSGADTDTLRFVTRPLLDLVPEPRSVGVVAIPASAAEPYVFEVTATQGAETAVGLVTVQPGYASTGTRGVAVDTDVILAGPSDQTAWLWTVEGRAWDAEVAATLEGADTRFPVVRLLLKDDLVVRETFSGTEIKLYGGTWDGFEPCGRCHEPEQSGWQGSRHATVLDRGLRGLLRGDYREECLGCHALGWQPGVHNGGFDDVARRIGWRFPTRLAEEAAQLPPDLARLGGVECLSCHGPGRFTPARFDTGMCAACHDKPPAYDHVRQWSETRMSRLGSLSDDHPALRRPCTRCHSTQGFVRWAKGAREPDPPLPHEAEAVACAACHDPHDGRRRHQVRLVDRVRIGAQELTEAGTGAVCMACHTLDEAARRPLEVAPVGGQAEVLLGITPLLPGEHKGPHGGLRDTCVACHRPHTFRTGDCSAPACAGCHEAACGSLVRGQTDADLTELTLRLEGALSKLQGGCGPVRGLVDDDHRLALAGKDERPVPDCSPASLPPSAAHLLRAGVLLETVRLDGSHGAHNPTWTRAALEAARTMLR